MDKIGVKIGLNRLPRAIVILCEILRQACKSCEICGIRVRRSRRFNEIQQEDYLWKFVGICGRKIPLASIAILIRYFLG